MKLDTRGLECRSRCRNPEAKGSFRREPDKPDRGRKNQEQADESVPDIPAPSSPETRNSPLSVPHHGRSPQVQHPRQVSTRRGLELHCENRDPESPAPHQTPGSLRVSHDPDCKSASGDNPRRARTDWESAVVPHTYGHPSNDPQLLQVRSRPAAGDDLKNVGKSGQHSDCSHATAR